ncbi:MAG: 16S rRNA (cytosine(1402)-N(4))-methyltransferase RsmH [bacterium]|nr:MAG: 16S rRNA (cytosine(1402)-N(4))-methyltransferase RsmH [bacterium]
MFHTPVLVDQVLKYLIGKPSGIYVDGTIGGAGHSLELLKKLSASGKLIGIDLDDKAIATAKYRLKQYENQIMLNRGNFKDIGKILVSYHINQVDGILLDLGVSSHQIDTGERGFSYLTQGPLDMRMSIETKATAKEIINTYSEQDLRQIFREFGEERKAHYVARAIIRERGKRQITTTQQLVKIIESVVPFQHRIKSLARIFQAIRIAVNKELENLQSFLNQSLDLLKSGGRLVLIAYHSLEDRRVKDFFSRQLNPCECPPGLPVCACGKQPTIRLLTRRVVRPNGEEVKANSRSRSAKLRAAEKI